MIVNYQQVISALANLSEFTEKHLSETILFERPSSANSTIHHPRQAKYPYEES